MKKVKKEVKKEVASDRRIPKIYLNMRMHLTRKYLSDLYNIGE